MATHYQSWYSKYLEQQNSRSKLQTHPSQTGSSPKPLQPTKKRLHTPDAYEAPLCATCRKPLQLRTDSQRTTGRFWKNCNVCRGKRTAANHRLIGKRTHISSETSRSNKRRKTQATADPTQSDLWPKERECSVCNEGYLERGFPSLSACAHEPDVCQGCFVGWLKGQVESTNWESVECPSDGCHNQIPHEDVLKYAPYDVFARFDELSIRSILSDDPDFRYCIAEGCSSGQIHETGVEGYIFSCGACGFRVCTVHDIPFHSGETCTQYDERVAKEEEEEAEDRRLEEEASREEVRRCAVVCPGCMSPIQKRSGCDHITCNRPRCGFEFCYECRAPYRGKRGIYKIGNSAHALDCSYSPENLPVFIAPTRGFQ